MPLEPRPKICAADAPPDKIGSPGAPYFSGDLKNASNTSNEVPSKKGTAYFVPDALFVLNSLGVYTQDVRRHRQP